MSKTIKGTSFMNRIKDAIDALRGKPHHSMTLGIEVKRCKDCTREMPQLGRWDKVRDGRWACSFCGAETEMPSPYCPWCGQKQVIIKGLTKEGEA